ncbi:MAG: ATP-grasp domain-containing protein [Bacilli bacterium]|nr:ATP-grasp domain-containing protein [Bacilli bacterium]
MNIGVLFGGKSVEHDISIISAQQVMKALDSKYQVIPLYLTKDLLLVSGDRFKDINTFKNELKIKKQEYANLIRINSANYLSFYCKKFKNKLKIDLILPIMHGKGVEDGNVSGFLEILDIPYTSADTESASICQDKEIAKIVLNSYNINNISYEVRCNNDYQVVNMEYPLIIKPARLGSSIGITKVKNDTEYLEALKIAYKYDKKVIVEKCLTNFKELSIACYKRKDELVLSDIEEIKLTSDIYYFTDKYQSSNKINHQNHELPANIKKDLKIEIEETTKKIYEKLMLKGVIRVDYLYDLDSKTLYVNEINTIPGSLAFYLFESKKITFTSLLDDLIKQALIDKDLDNNYLTSFKSSILEKNNLRGKK